MKTGKTEQQMHDASANGAIEFLWKFSAIILHLIILHLINIIVFSIGPVNNYNQEGY